MKLHDPTSIKIFVCPISSSLGGLIRSSITTKLLRYHGVKWFHQYQKILQSNIFFNRGGRRWRQFHSAQMQITSWITNCFESALSLLCGLWGFGSCFLKCESYLKLPWWNNIVRKRKHNHTSSTHLFTIYCHGTSTYYLGSRLPAPRVISSWFPLLGIDKLYSLGAKGHNI
jgi:hypothetical protein